MKRMTSLLLLLGLCAIHSLADIQGGVRGPFTVKATTVWHGVTTNPSVQLPESTTYIDIECSDRSVTGVRVTLTYETPDGKAFQVNMAADLSGRQYGTVTTNIPPGWVRYTKYTELRDGASH
jgi:hypothetical protein